MTGRTKLFFGTALVGVALVAAVIVAIVIRARSEAPGVPSELVPPSWESFRTSAGHKIHVGKDGLACKNCHDYEREGFKNPGSAVCVRCHTKEGAHAHVGNSEKKTECLTCHEFAPGREPPRCISCHAEPEGKHAAIVTHATTE